MWPIAVAYGEMTGKSDASMTAYVRRLRYAGRVDVAELVRDADDLEAARAGAAAHLEQVAGADAEAAGHHRGDERLARAEAAGERDRLGAARGLGEREELVGGDGVGDVGPRGAAREARRDEALWQAWEQALGVAERLVRIEERVGREGAAGPGRDLLLERRRGDVQREQEGEHHHHAADAPGELVAAVLDPAPQEQPLGGPAARREAHGERAEARDEVRDEDDGGEERRAREARLEHEEGEQRHGLPEERAQQAVDEHHERQREQRDAAHAPPLLGPALDEARAQGARDVEAERVAHRAQDAEQRGQGAGAGDEQHRAPGQDDGVERDARAARRRDARLRGEVRERDRPEQAERRAAHAEQQGLAGRRPPRPGAAARRRCAAGRSRGGGARRRR